MEIEYNLKHVSYEKVIIIVHGFFSHKDKARLVALEEELCQDGFSVLRFTFSYVKSTKLGSLSLLGSQIQDMKCILSLLKQKDYKKIGIVGESFGSAIALVSFQNEISTYVLWSPVTSALVRKRTYVKLILEDLLFSGQGSFFENIHIKSTFLKEALLINAKQVLGSITVPVLILHGTKDNVVPLKSSRNALKTLPRASLIEIDNAGHIFDAPALPKVLDHTKRWLSVYM